MRADRRQIDAACAVRASEAITRTILAMPNFAAARTIGLYRALPGEVSLAGLESAARSEGKTLLLPRWDATGNRYVWAAWPAGSALVRGRHGVEEPAGTTPASAEPDLALVPGLAFDRAGRRLGHGAGHFDRLLAAGRGRRLGIAFQRQIVRRVPTGPHDVAMHGVVTECGLIGTSTPGHIPPFNLSGLPSEAPAKPHEAAAARKRGPYKPQSDTTCRAAACGVPRCFARDSSLKQKQE